MAQFKAWPVPYGRYWHSVSFDLPTQNATNIANTQWSVVASLPVPNDHPSLTICGDYVYIHPRTDDDQEKYSVYKCSLRQLTLSQPSSAIWETLCQLAIPLLLPSMNTCWQWVGRTPMEIERRTYISTTWHHGLSLVKYQHREHYASLLSSLGTS